MAIKRSSNRKKKKMTSAEKYSMEEKLFFLQKRINELIDKLEYIERDLERMTFVMVLFGKYMQYYSTKNDNLMNGDVVKRSIISTNLELEQGFHEKAITSFEQEMIIAYLQRIQKKISNEEKKKWR